VRRLKIFLLLVCRSSGLLRLTSWLTRRRLRILCYHGFSCGDEADFRPQMFMRPERFEERLKALKRRGMRVIPLDEAIDRLYSRSLPDYAVVITVDDGLHSFHSLALPRLVRHQFPATVYVTTYYVQKAVPVFRLVVQYMFWKTRQEIVVPSAPWWTAENSINLRNPAESRRAMGACIDFGERRCSEAQRQQMCKELGDLLEVSFESILASRSLHLISASELRALESSNISVGLHTHRHSFPEDDPERAIREVRENQQELSSLVGKVVPHFCYPSGVWREHEWAWLDKLGVKSSATSMPGLNTAKTPRHALRRYLDGDDVHALEFEAAICGFMALLHGMKALLAYRGRPGPS
jgi:peptidoglycan/xylan/chitin deacetylase (PgdA/CDA1 family)